jgi:hypothetical protein
MALRSLAGRTRRIRIPWKVCLPSRSSDDHIRRIAHAPQRPSLALTATRAVETFPTSATAADSLGNLRPWQIASNSAKVGALEQTKFLISVLLTVFPPSTPVKCSPDKMLKQWINDAGAKDSPGQTYSSGDNWGVMLYSLRRSSSFLRWLGGL